MTEPPLPDVAGVEHRWETVNGFRMHYAEAGAGDPLVLVHGWPQHWWMWRDYFGRLSQRYRVIAPDLRGHGWSEKPRSSYRKRELADDLLALLDRLDLDTVRLVGHDWGAVTSVLLAAAHPERVQRLMVLSIPHPWQRRPDLRTAAVGTYQFALAGPWGRYAIRNGFMRRMLKMGRSLGSFSEDEIECYQAIQREDDAVAASVRMYRTFLARELVPWTRGGFVPERLHVPTLWLIGERDALARQADDGYLDHTDDMTLEFVPGANHFMPEELPQTVLDRMLEFL